LGRGFLAGIFWGGLVGLGMLFVSSQAIERQSLSLPQPTAAAVEVPGGSEFDQAREETDPVLPETESRPDSEPIGLTEAPSDAVETPPSFETSALEVPTPSVGEAGDLAVAPAQTTAPDAPEASDAARPADSTGDLVVPDAPGNAPDTNDDAPGTVEAPTAGDETTVVPENESTGPSGTDVASLPDTNEDQAISNETGNAPSIASDANAPTGLTAPTVGEEPALPSAGDTGSDTPQLPQLTTPQAPEASGSAPEIATAPEAPPLPNQSETPNEQSPAGPTIGLQDQGTIEFGVSEEQQDTIQAAVEDSLSQPEKSEPEEVAEETPATRTLPTVRRLGADNSPEPEAEPEAEAEDIIVGEGTDGEDSDALPSEDDGLTDNSAPAIQAFRSEFDNAEGNPLMSLILVQEGDTALNSAQLEGLPPSISLALDAGAAGAADFASLYRSMGREVVMIPSLPEGATPQDVEQALAVNFDTVREAVAIMDISGSSFQANRGSVQQVVDVVSDSGHGLITFPRGLNTAHQSATRAGVPTGLIFRRLDGGGETRDQIRRTLDRAAFRARQDEAVILVGTTATDTMATIVEWSTGNRASSVTLAPISAALLNE